MEQLIRLEAAHGGGGVLFHSSHRNTRTDVHFKPKVKDQGTILHQSTALKERKRERESERGTVPINLRGEERPK